MFCSVQQNQHTSTEPRSRRQIVAHCSLRSEITNLHVNFWTGLFELGVYHQRGRTLTGSVYE